MEGNKMKLFQTNKLVMRWYSLYPPAEGTGRAKKLAYLAVSAVVFFINFAGMLSTSLFAFKHISIDFEESLYAILPAAALFKISYMSVVAYTIRPQIVGLIEKYSDYYKSYANDPKMASFLAAGNERSERLTKSYFKYIVVGYFVCSFSIIIGTTMSRFLRNGYIEPDNVYSSYKVVLPFSQNVLTGKLISTAFGGSFATTFLFANGVIITIFMSFCEQGRAFSDQFHYVTQNLDKTCAHKSLHKMIKLHMKIKDLFIESAEIYSLLIWIEMVCSSMHLASAVYQLDLALRHWDAIIFDAIAGTVSGGSSLFAYCYFGSVASASFARMSESLYHADWINFRPELRKYFVIAIGNAQRPMWYHGFHVIDLHLPTYTKIMKGVGSYYMMFKTVAAK